MKICTMEEQALLVLWHPLLRVILLESSADVGPGEVDNELAITTNKEV